MKLDDRFRDSVLHLDLALLDAGADVIYFLDDNLILRGFNTAWERFAVENDGADILIRFGLGCRVLDVIPSQLKGHYARAYLRALESGNRFDQDFECSSPDTFRLYHQTAYPLPTRAGLCITNHITRLRPHASETWSPVVEYRTAEGIVVQCQHCDKLRHPKEPTRWDWVPEAVAMRHPDVSHGLCPYCLEHYYPDLAGVEQGRR